MSTPEPPEYLEKLSTDQRAKLLEFIDRADAVIGNGDFDHSSEWQDCEIMALALRAAQILGYEGEGLEALFQREFGIAGVTEGDLETCLAVLTLVDVERRIRVACGGRN
jgi:hypothetical protein